MNATLFGTHIRLVSPSDMSAMMGAKRKLPWIKTVCGPPRRTLASMSLPSSDQHAKEIDAFPLGVGRRAPSGAGTLS